MAGKHRASTPGPAWWLRIRLLAQLVRLLVESLIVAYGSKNGPGPRS